MPYDEDKQLQDETEEVSYRIKLLSTLLVPTKSTMRVTKE